MSKIIKLFKGKYVLVNSIDEAIELTIENNVYSRSESSELLAELERACEAFGAAPLRFGIWSPEDVLYQAGCMDEGKIKPDAWLTEDDAHSILERIIDKHDAEIGINWGVIDVYLDEFKRDKREIWYDTRLRLKRDLQGEDDGWSECGWHTLPEGTEVTFEGKRSCRSGGLYATVTSAQSERGKKFRFDPKVINVSMPGGTGEIVNLDDFEILDRGREWEWK